MGVAIIGAFVALLGEVVGSVAMRTESGIASVIADAEATAREIADLEAAFRRAGFEVEVNPVYERKSAAGAVLPWVVSVTLLTPIGVFLSKFAEQAAEDAYPAVKRWVKDVWAARRSADGSLALEDPEHTHLILAARIPERAIDALADLDWTAKRGHYLVWDDAREEWRDPTRPDSDAA